MQNIDEQDKNKYITNATNPFVKLSKTVRVCLGACVGLSIAGFANTLNKRPFMTRPHRHLFYMIACSAFFYKTYDFNDYIVKKELYVLSLTQDRIREQELLKKRNYH
ncbi:hypothetical protein DICPUDRAFT_150984 [Dictyostelium purpureum]|uniref:Uncharacterized protein n=1 Tax=Dictyostelium purpureum TaxID=5786 RepID=F0ZHQ9_DICPU|nr:uncharacterized protein DICPUDRAFT_150984 [Dictyostelium purpureum]EGC36504.1 hypothetical protein DICPUDRAFT_150984 [Dictyostelium purpureum]|eukprot:XP_003286949.1 hypothetical protein DICPUDRAFT_150984 [Dictyostelium purpureum]